MLKLSKKERRFLIEIIPSHKCPYKASYYEDVDPKLSVDMLKHDAMCDGLVAKLKDDK